MTQRKCPEHFTASHLFEQGILHDIPSTLALDGTKKKLNEKS
jgi:hypothetical protein